MTVTLVILQGLKGSIVVLCFFQGFYKVVPKLRPEYFMTVTLVILQDMV